MIKKAMASRIAAGACWLSLILLCSSTLVSPLEADVLPTRWQVQADGWSGTLELSVEPSGAISGTLQDQTVTGFLAGRRLVLRRTIGDRAEVWEGWLAEDPEVSMLFIAGSVTIGDDGSLHPWYAVPEPKASPGDPAPAVLSPVAGTPAEPAEDPAPGAAAAAAPGAGATAPGEEAHPTEEPLASAPGVTRSQASDWVGPDVSGAWLAVDGRVEIVQEGPSLTVVLPDGTRHEGRFTAADTLVVGLRRGCCKGKLEGSGQVTWSDGTVWQRAD